MKNKDFGIILNLFIILFEIIGIVIYILNHSSMDLQYYTHDSNILALITSIIYLCFVSRGKELPKWASLLKYTSTVALSITFLIVIFVLAPIDNFDYRFYLLDKSMLYFHLICPLLVVISFIFFEEHKISGFKDSIRALYYTFIYSIVLFILNIVKLIDGPYPFLRIRNNSFIVTIIWMLCIVGFSIGISVLLGKLNKRNKKSIN